MHPFRFTKEQIDILIDTLITTGGGESPYGKFSAILESLTFSTGYPPLLRHNLLLWLDTMAVLDVNFQEYTYKVVKPKWVQSAVKERYILVGALTIDEQVALSEKGYKNLPNSIRYQEFSIELPSTFYTEDKDLAINSGFEIMPKALFERIESEWGCEEILSKIQEEGLSGILTVEDKLANKENPYFVYSFKVGKQCPETISFSQSSKIEKFNWRTRNYDKCNLSEELRDLESIKLIRFSKETYAGTKKYTLLLESCDQGDSWTYYYFDSKQVDERWARVIYLNKEDRYDTFYDIKKSEEVTEVDRNDESSFDERRGGLVRNLIRNVRGYSKSPLPYAHEFVEFDQYDKIKIPATLKKSVMTYDVRNGILAIPKTIPLPTVFMRFLFSCTGELPVLFTNNFVPNPGYPVKLLFSGKLSRGGVDIPYPNPTYYMEEEVYLFGGVPRELADALSQKLGWFYNKMTFLKS